MSARILIADDSELIRSAIASLIRGLGHEVCGEVSDGAAAIQKAFELKPDLLILDVAMPRRNGWSAALELRASLPSLPILFYTLLPSEFLDAEAKRVGFLGVVQKDNANALIAAIRAALESRPADEDGAEAATA